nr:zinc ABC transporter substrate-binding protein [Shimazuella soli]
MVLGLSGCSLGAIGNHPNPNQIQVVAAENEYSNVVKQIGGKYVSVTSMMDNPSTDPHTYEASTKNASDISSAALVIQNGLGYDDFMNKLESASPNEKRVVIEVAASLGYGKNTLNPHLWYKPDTMSRVAKLIEDELSKQKPSEAKYFQANLQKFDSSLQSWNQALSNLKKSFPNAPVAVTEPVGDYLLEAAGLDVKTPWPYQAAVMNGIDPSPQVVQMEDNLLKHHQVKALLYNQQAVDNVTTALLKLAKENHIPVVGVYETMPSNHTYQKWMEEETKALQNAIQNGSSTETIS